MMRLYLQTLLLHGCRFHGAVRETVGSDIWTMNSCLAQIIVRSSKSRSAREGVWIRWTMRFQPCGCAMGHQFQGRQGGKVRPRGCWLVLAHHRGACAIDPARVRRLLRDPRRL